MRADSAQRYEMPNLLPFLEVVLAMLAVTLLMHQDLLKTPLSPFDTSVERGAGPPAHRVKVVFRPEGILYENELLDLDVVRQRLVALSAEPAAVIELAVLERADGQLVTQFLILASENRIRTEAVVRDGGR